MIYKYDVRKNKKMYLLYGIIGLLVLAGIPVWLIAGNIPGLVAEALFAYIAFSLFKAAKSFANNKIETYTEGMSVSVPGGEKVSFDWDEITHAGYIFHDSVSSSYEMIFVYAEEKDSIIQLPPNYIGFSEFIEELNKAFPLKEYHLEDGQTIIDYLKKEMGMVE